MKSVPNRIDINEYLLRNDLKGLRKIYDKYIDKYIIQGYPCMYCDKICGYIAEWILLIFKHTATKISPTVSGIYNIYIDELYNKHQYKTCEPKLYDYISDVERQFAFKYNMNLAQCGIKTSIKKYKCGTRDISCILRQVDIALPKFLNAHLNGLKCCINACRCFIYKVLNTINSEICENTKYELILSVAYLYDINSFDKIYYLYRKYGNIMDNMNVNKHMFEYVCQEGDLEIVKWLYGELKYKRIPQYAFECAKQNKNRRIIPWMYNIGVGKKKMCVIM